ncbi:MAG: hypothetical protein OEY30_00255 [Candidatus Bathyarchaeota archaeon]|nr:hypothetical protein [Candidatus Bathyarchaeota archaeon]
MKKKVLIAVLAVTLLLIGAVSAAVITYFGKVKVTTTVSQAVLLDDHSYPYVIEEVASVAGGESFWRYHWLTSLTTVPVALDFVTSFAPALTDDEITLTYTTTITEGPANEYSWLYHQLVALPISGMNLSELLAFDLEYTTRVTQLPAGLGYAANINIKIQNATGDFWVQAWGKDWLSQTTGLHTVDFEGLVNGTLGYGAEVTSGLGAAGWPSEYYYSTADLTTSHGGDTVLLVEVRAQGGANQGQQIRPTQFVVAGRTINLPDAYSLTGLTLPAKVILKFAIGYSFDVLTQAGTYNIYSTVEPPP